MSKDKLNTLPEWARVESNLGKGQVGGWTIQWRRPPVGSSGTEWARVSKGEMVQVCQISWRRTETGIGLEVVEDSKVPQKNAQEVLCGNIQYRLAREIRDDGNSEWKIEAPELHVEGLEWQTSRTQLMNAQKKSGSSGEIKIKAQMPGKVVRILCAPGSVVEKGAGLLVLEAMKMENEIRAPHSGEIKSIFVQAGQAVESGVELIRMGVKNA